MMRLWASVFVSSALIVRPQGQTLFEGPYRMEITLERLQGDAWRAVDPGLVLAQGDDVRFRFRTNFDGYLYVTNLSSSGAYQQLFPLAEAGDNNRILSDAEYVVPADSSAMFRVAGPSGYETIYWLLTPVPLSITGTLPSFGNAKPKAPLRLIPRCDGTILRARGDCVDRSAGPALLTRDARLPDDMAHAATDGSRDLVVTRQGDKSVILSQQLLRAPVVYSFRLAHR